MAVVTPREVCGDIEYADPKHPEFTLCAPQLIFQGWDGDRDVFDESPAFGADRCVPATLEIAVDGYVGAADVGRRGLHGERCPTVASGDPDADVRPATRR